MKKTDMLIRKTPVVIFAGGTGINLGEGMIPKPLLEVNGAPLLFHIMEHYSSAGFRNFIICAGSGIELLRRFVSGLGRRWNVSVAATGEQSRTGARLARVRPLLKENPVFCLTYGDTYSRINLRAAFAFHLEHGKMATLAAVRQPTRFRILGLFDLDDDVRGFADKPVLERDYINGGFYILNREVFDLHSLKPAEACVLEDEVLDELVERRQLCAFRLEDYWQPLDNEKDRRKIENEIMDHREKK